MDNNTFRGLHNLERLKITLDHLDGFSKGTFLGLHNVISLDLTGCQTLCTRALTTALSDTTVLPLLLELKLKSLGTTGCVEIEVDQTFVDILGIRRI